MDSQEARTFRPTVVMVDASNRIVEVRRGEAHGDVG